MLDYQLRCEGVPNYTEHFNLVVLGMQFFLQDFVRQWKEDLEFLPLGENFAHFTVKCINHNLRARLKGLIRNDINKKL